MSLVKDLFGVLKYAKRRLKEGITPVSNNNHKIKCFVLCNGPSLNDELPSLNIQDADCFVVNFFASSDYYESVRPTGYFLLDPRFWRETSVKENVVKMYEDMEAKTTWAMSLYVPKNSITDIKKFHTFLNPNIKVIPYSTALAYSGFKKYENYFYKKQWATIPAQNVPLFAIYIALVLGYKHIELYGIDYSFFEGMVINDDNELCYSFRHFYGDEKPQLRKYIDVHTGKVVKLKDEIISVGNIYAQHEKMEQFSHYMNATIINCTKKSMLDYYIRKSQIEKGKKNEKN